MMKRKLFAGVIALTLYTPLTRAAAVYFDRQSWEQALNLTTTNQLVSVGLSNDEWSESFSLQPGVTQRVSQSNTAASDGMGIYAVSSYSIPGVADNSTLGHVAQGLWTDALSKYGVTTFNFSQQINAFGGDFAIQGMNGLFISSIGNVGAGASGYTGFIGFILDQPTSSVLISWGDDARCPYCFGNSYTLANLQVGTLATPEPNFRFAIAGIFIAIAGVFFVKFCRAS